ncbi:MAG TPA: CopD family protein [Rhodanobacteraceae bacterium]|nr:CopD family protein [Rhodanobacteraceae bacterium]
MRWLIAFHIVFVVTWFAGLFYLPRLFVYHAEAREPALREQFKVMERRLLVMTHIGGALAILMGLALVGWWSQVDAGYLTTTHWFSAKMGLVVLLLAYHGMLVKLRGEFARDACRWTSRRLRLFNELPGLLLIGIVILAVAKPF